MEVEQSTDIVCEGGTVHGYCIWRWNSLRILYMKVEQYMDIVNGGVTVH
jgi:hypothetical protein